MNIHEFKLYNVNPFLNLDCQFKVAQVYNEDRKQRKSENIFRQE